MLAHLIELYAGAFPLWLAPVQAVAIPIADRHGDYARHVQRELREHALRVEVDDSGERMNAKIRRAQLQKVPYMLVVGDREAQSEQVAVRDRSGDDLGAMPLFQLADRMVDERDSRAAPPRGGRGERVLAVASAGCRARGPVSG